MVQQGFHPKKFNSGVCAVKHYTIQGCISNYFVLFVLCVPPMECKLHVGELILKTTAVPGVESTACLLASPSIKAEMWVKL